MPASSENVREPQDIYTSANHLDRELREICKTQSPFDKEPTQLRSRIRNDLVELLLRHLDYAADKDIEQFLWKTVHYRVIDDFRKRLRHTTSTHALTACTNPEGYDSTPQHSKINNLLKKDSRMLLNASFRQFLIESVGFYISVLRQMRIEYDLDIVEKIVFHRLGTEPFGSIDVLDGSTNSRRISTETKDKARFICHRFLLSLGDLARYKEFYAERKEKNYNTSKLFYRLASQLEPDSGNPHNQLAVVESHENQQLGAVERYLRSLLIRQPFMAAKDNLIILLQKHGSKVDGFNQFDELFLAFLGRLFSSEEVHEAQDVERLKQMVLNGFKNMFTKKQVNHASDMMQMFMITIGSLELATNHTEATKKQIGHPNMIVPIQQLLSELIITICNTTAYRLGTAGSSHNALTSTAVAPTIIQNDPIKQVSKFLSSIKLVVMWLKTRYSMDHDSLEFLDSNAWKSLGDALNALSAISCSTHDDLATLVQDIFLVEDLDLATFTPVTPTKIATFKGGLDAKNCAGSEEKNCEGHVEKSTETVAKDGRSVDPLKLILRLICGGDRRSDDEQSMCRIHQIVQASRELCQSLGKNLFHATRISPDGIEYDYFAVTRIPSTMAADSITRVSLVRELQTSSPNRPDVRCAPHRGDEENEDLIDDTELFAPRRFNPAAVVGSSIHKRHASSHLYIQQPVPSQMSIPVSLPSPVNNISIIGNSNVDWARRISQPDPVVAHALNSAAQVTRNQSALNRNGYHHIEDYEDVSMPPRFTRPRPTDTRMGPIGDHHDHTQSTMRFLELEGAIGSPAYSNSRNTAAGARPSVKYATEGLISMESSSKYSGIGNQRYDYGANFFGGNSVGSTAGNSSRLPSGLSGSELSWTAFNPQQTVPSNAPTHWYRPPPPAGLYTDVNDVPYGRYSSTSLPSSPVTTAPTTTSSMGFSWLTGLPEENNMEMGMNDLFGRRMKPNSSQDGAYWT